MVISIDLKRNPDVSALLADLDMGAKVKLLTSLKSKTDDLAEFTLEKAAECSDADMKDHYGDDEEEEGETPEEAVVDGTQQKRHAKMPSPGGSPNTPGGSVEQDRMAASLAAQL